MKSKQKFVYIGPHPTFLRRAKAVALANTSTSTTTVIVESNPPPNPTMAFDSAKPMRMMTHDAALAPRRPVDPTFKMVFQSVVALTVLTFVVWVLTALITDQTAAIKGVEEGSRSIAQAGFGAIFGLIGGKAA
jgi:hypothetical protein